MQRLSISIIFLFIFLLASASGTEHSRRNSDNPHGIINIDSTQKIIKAQGWNNSLLETFSNYIINSDISSSQGNQLLADLPGNYQKSYLYSLILKKQKNFRAMYDSLSFSLNYKPDFFPYYDELVFSANANNLTSALEVNIEKDKRIPVLYSNYVFGLIKSTKGDFQSALGYFQKIVKQDSVDVFPLFHISYTYRNLGDYPKALKILHSAIRHSNNNPWLTAKLYPAEGSLYYLSGKYKEAENFYKKSYDIALKINDKQDEAKSLINLGIITDMTGDSKAARKKFEKAISISGSINDMETEATALSELGVSYSFTNNLIEAKNNYEKSYKIFKSINNRLRLALLSGNIGKIYMSLFDYESALKYFKEGLNYSAENKRARVLNLTGIADVNSNLSNYANALKYYREAKKIASEIKELSLSADIEIGLGILSFNLDRYYNALNHFKTADSLGGYLGDPYLTADTYYKLGMTYFCVDSIINAKYYFEKAVDTSSRYKDYYTEASALTDFAVFYLKGKDVKKALRLLDKADKISSGQGFTYLTGKERLIRGDILKEENYLVAADESYKDALKIGEELNEFNLQIDANYKLAKLFENSGFNLAAGKYYKNAIKLIESVAYPLFNEEQVQISYFASKYKVYDSYIQFLIDRKEFTEAFNVLDKSRSRSTIQNLNNLKLESLLQDKNELRKIYEYEWMVHSGIYGKNKTDSIKTVYAKLKDSLIAKQPKLRNYLNMREYYSLDKIQKGLKGNEDIISIFSSPKNSVIFLIKNDSFKHFVIKLTKDQIFKYLSQISPYYNDSHDIAKSYYNHDLFAFNTKAAFDFYSKLLKPVLKDIPHNDKLIFSPSIDFISFPFEFLVTSFDNYESAYNYSNKHYLIQDYDISYTPSAGMYIKQEQNNLKDDNKVLIVGDPVINTHISGFAERRGLLENSPVISRNIALLPLKYSEEEITKIGSIINVTKILVKNDATETNFKQDAPYSKLIHLSTHSILHNNQPVIFFSNTYDPYNDGFLEASEVAQLKLNSDLVVLSSCNSGLGVVDESEGVLGMAKAFFEAGAKSVVVSLWEVNDKYTSQFMGLFYENLSKGLNKAEALRQAKIGFIKNYSANPYYWGAFVLDGNTSKVNLRPDINTLPYLFVLSIIIFISIVVIIYRSRKIKLTF